MKTTGLIILCICSLNLFAQNKYGLTAMKLSEYKESVAANPENELINLEKFIPGLVLEIRYATTGNFTGQKIYHLARAYARS
jgi:zinc D-Ala-D-Ala dipeptidase